MCVCVCGTIIYFGGIISQESKFLEGFNFVTMVYAVQLLIACSVYVQNIFQRTLFCGSEINEN